jgi:hypothetical protein
VDQAIQVAAADPARLTEVHPIQDALADYKIKTQQIALVAALVLGILISALGIRGMGTLVDPKTFPSPVGPQQR